jgi:outer membrane protein assembly factor BamB
MRPQAGDSHSSTSSSPPGPSTTVQLGCPTPRAAAVGLDSAGRVSWRVSLPEGSAEEFAADPVVSGTRTFAVYDGRVTALDSISGRVLWSRALGLGVQQQLAAGAVLVETSIEGESLTGLDTETGRVVWSWKAPGGMLGSGLLTADGGIVITARARSQLVVIEARTGRVRWSVPVNPGPSQINPPAIAPGVVLVASGASLFALDDKTGTRIWREPFPPAGQLTPVVSGDVVVVTSGVFGPGQAGRFEGFDLNTGRVLWTSPYPADPGPTFAAPGGFVTFPELSTQTHSPLPGQIDFFDARTGRIRWTYGKPSSPAFPAVDSPAYIIGNNIGIITEYRTNHPEVFLAIDQASGTLVGTLQPGDHVTGVTVEPAGAALVTGILPALGAGGYAEEINSYHIIWKTRLDLPVQTHAAPTQTGSVVEESQVQCATAAAQTEATTGPR